MPVRSPLGVPSRIMRASRSSYWRSTALTSVDPLVGPGARGRQGLVDDRVLDRAVAPDGGLCASQQVSDLVLTQRGHVLDQLNVHVREAVARLVVVSGHADELLEVIAEAGSQARVRAHCVAARDRELEQVAGGRRGRGRGRYGSRRRPGCGRRTDARPYAASTET